METKSKYLMKNMGILTISNFSSKILVFLLVPLYTSVLSAAEYGSYDLAVSIATLLYPMLTLNIVDAVMRFSMDQACEKKRVASIGLKFVSISIVIFALGMYVLHTSKLWPDINGLEFFILLYYISYVINNFLIQFSKGLEKVVDMAIAGIISTVVTVAGNVLFLLVFKYGLTGFFFANILAQAVSALYLCLRLRIWSYIELGLNDKDLQKEMLLYCTPLMASTIGWWVNSTADKYAVTFMLGVASNGILSVSYKLPSIINTLQGIFIQARNISAIKEYGEQDTAKFYGNTFVIINLMMCTACSWLILLTRPLAHILYAKDFYQAWQYVPFLLIASVFNCASGLLGPILSAQKNSKAMMWSALIGAGANIVMNIVLVHFIGIQGATIATVICSYIIYVVRKIAVGKDIKIEGYVVVLFTWGLLCVQAFVESYLGNYVIEVVVMAALLAINIKPLQSLITMARTLILSLRK